ncbi:MAG: tail fiber protein [Pedobacter agri]|nr:MAG: phage tail protein [Flavobacteriales bacterium]
MDEYIAVIKLFAGNFAMRGWAFCNGQLLSIQQNSAVFALVGTTYGGDGQNTFGLPDLRGRVAIGATFGVPGPGLSQYQLGQKAGTENTTILINHMPPHNHTAILTPIADNSIGNTSSPSGNRLAISPKTGSGPNATTLNTYTSASSNPVTLGTAAGQSAITVGNNGSGLPFSILQPYLALSYIFCLQGIFPSRN